MEEALREDRIKKIMEATGVSRPQAEEIEAIESGKTTGDTFCINEDGSVSPSTSKMIYEIDDD